jgi:uncharacterized protein
MTSPTLYPGVYVREVASNVRPITGVATSITAFLGRAVKGPVDNPVTVNGFADYQRIFGGLSPDSTLGFAVRDFFANGGGQALVVRLAKDATASALTVSGLGLEAASPGGWSDRLTVTIEAGSTDPDVAARYGVLPADLFTLTVTDGRTGASETFANLTVLPLGRDVRHVLAEQSSLIVATTLPATTPAPGTATVTTVGTDGTALDDNSYIGANLATQRRGLWALDHADLFNLLCIPPPTLDEDDQTSPAVYGAALTYCEKRRAMLIVDPPPALTKDTVARELVTLNLTGARARNAALYYPRLRAPDPTAENRQRTFVPCGAMAGVMARTDAARGVWKAPAGIDATLAGVSDLTVNLTNDENGMLNPYGVNCLRTFPVFGRVVWGARTLRGADQLADEYKYVPVRRLALYLEESLFRGTQWVVFEPNDEPLWAQIRLNLGAFMQGLFRQGAFEGTNPRDAYFVKCDAETTTVNDRNLGRVNILVGFAPLRPAEFVILQIQQIARAQA